MKIGVLGLGAIATALVEGLAGDKHEIVVSARSHANSRRLSAQFKNVTVVENQKVLDASDIVFLGTTGEAAPGTMEALHFREGHQVVSLMGDLSFTATADLVAPATMAARMIPFPVIAAGGSPILSFGDNDLIDDLFGGRNTVFRMSTEAELTSYLCAQAVLSPAVTIVNEAAEWLATHGAAEQDAAEAFLRLLVGRNLLQSPCAELLRALDTPGGYNQRLRRKMLEGGLDKRLRDGLDSLID